MTGGLERSGTVSLSLNIKNGERENIKREIKREREGGGGRESERLSWAGDYTLRRRIIVVDIVQVNFPPIHHASLRVEILEFS